MFNVIKIDQFIIRPAQKPTSAHRSSGTFGTNLQALPCARSLLTRVERTVQRSDDFRNENPVVEKPKLLGG